MRTYVQKNGHTTDKKMDNERTAEKFRWTYIRKRIQSTINVRKQSRIQSYNLYTHGCRYMAETLPIRRKTLSNQYTYNIKKNAKYKYICLSRRLDPLAYELIEINHLQ